MTADPDTGQAKAEIDLYRELYLSSSQHQAGYGRWILASLLAVHVGSLLAITQAGTASRTLFEACGPFLLFGVATALVCGGLAWLNFSTAMHFYGTVVIEMTEGRAKPKASLLQRILINSTLCCTPILAGFSLFLFVLAAVSAFEALPEP